MESQEEFAVYLLDIQRSFPKEFLSFVIAHYQPGLISRHTTFPALCTHHDEVISLAISG